jgi:MoxR-like ATPase
LANEIGDKVVSEVSKFVVGREKETEILLMCLIAKALLAGRNYVTPDDIKSIASDVLTHRLTIDRAAAMKGGSRNTDDIVISIFDRVEPPR